MFKIMLVAAFAVIVSAQAQQPRGERGDRGGDRGATYTVSERQLEFLLEMASRAAAKAQRIEKDFGTAEVMPRERDRRDFRREMADIQPNEMIGRWIERVKKGEHNPPPVVVPVLPAPADVTLTESFVYTSGFSSYYATDFNKAADAAAKDCAAWRESVTKSTVGSSTYAQCSGAEQVKMDDGNLGAKVTGQIKLSFARYPGYVAPKTVQVTLSNNSGFSSYYAADFTKAAGKSRTQCDEWVAGIRAKSKGLILYTTCSAVARAKGFGGNLYASVVGTVAYTHPPTASQPNVLNQEFSTNSGFSSYYEADYTKAAATSKAQCEAWVADTIKNSAAIPVLALCSGPELVSNSNVYARYSGQVILLTP